MLAIYTIGLQYFYNIFSVRKQFPRSGMLTLITFITEISGQF